MGEDVQLLIIGGEGELSFGPVDVRVVLDEPGEAQNYIVADRCGDKI